VVGVAFGFKEIDDFGKQQMKHFVLSLSVVSHGQVALVSDLLSDIQKYCAEDALEVLLTLNVPEPLPDLFNQFTFPLKVIHNTVPLGFGENHNRAFEQARGDFFCVINPDIRLDGNVFPTVMTGLGDASIGLVAPLVVDGSGAVEDSARRFPTPLKILCKLIGRCAGSDYVIRDAPIYPDWVGGMFMVLRRDVYKELNGFNQKYFLYYEDVDLCARLWLKGLKVALIPKVRATHRAQRSSHKKIRYLWIHIRSMLRFFFSSTFLRLMCLRTRR
jgi:N-acetylglucosaminyl-diphospho-decaprenol L-rhamnosyltransferase